MKTKHEWARALAARGLRVFPLKANTKQPAIKEWQRHATSDADQIDRWWTGEFTESNIGVATGQGLLVLDCDSKGGRCGLEDLAMLDMLGLPESFRVRTPSGGVHVYLTVPKDVTVANSAGKLDGYPGIDVRSDGGLVVGPGSTIDGVAYEVL